MEKANKKIKQFDSHLNQPVFFTETKTKKKKTTKKLSKKPSATWVTDRF